MTNDWDESSSSGQIDALLYDLCVERGVSICQKDAAKIATTRPLDAGRFATLVLEAEGKTPDEYSHWFAGIQKRFSFRFGNAAVIH